MRSSLQFSLFVHVRPLVRRADVVKLRGLDELDVLSVTVPHIVLEKWYLARITPTEEPLLCRRRGLFPGGVVLLTVTGAGSGLASVTGPQLHLTAWSHGLVIPSPVCGGCLCSSVLSSQGHAFVDWLLW